MTDTYDITYDSAPVGRALMKKQGLYYAFSCRCRLPDEGLYRIHAISADRREDLGICVPMDGGFGMDKKIPIKRMGEGELTFQLVPKDWKQQEPAIVPEPEKPLQEEEKPDAQTMEPEPTAAEAVIAEQENIAEETVFVPVSEDEPFEHLDKLEQAHMEIQDDQPGIAFFENTEE